MTEVYSIKPGIFRLIDFCLINLLGLLLVTGQSALTAWTARPGFGVEWVLILAMYVALRAPLWVAVLAAFSLGFVRDAGGGGLLGLYQFTLILLIWLFYPYRARLNFFSPWALIPLVFVSCLGSSLFILTPVMAVVGWPGPEFNPIPGFLVTALATALAAPPTFYILTKLTLREKKQNDYNLPAI